jgi:hypothetical protein
VFVAYQKLKEMLIFIPKNIFISYFLNIVYRLREYLNEVDMVLDNSRKLQETENLILKNLI